MSVIVEIGKPFCSYKLFYGVFIPECITKYRGISAGAKLTLGRLTRYCGPDSTTCDPPVPDLADELGIGETQARTYIQELKVDGFISITRRGQGFTNLYTILGHSAYNDFRGESRRTPPTTDLEPRYTEVQETRSTEGQDPRSTEDASLLVESFSTESLTESYAEPCEKTEEQTPLPEERSEEVKESSDDPDNLFDNNYDLVDNLLYKEFGKHLGARPSTESKEMKFFDGLMEQHKQSVESVAALIGNSGAKNLAAFIKQHGGFYPSKSNRAPAPQQQRISRNGASVTQRGRPSYSTQPSASNAQKQHTAQTAALVQRWNELVPAKPANLEGAARGYKVEAIESLCQDEEFIQGFDTICKKAAAQGPWCNFGWLPFDKQDGKGPNWGKLLRGELDGLGSAGGGFKANRFSRDSLRATAEADIARRAQL